MRGSSSLLVLGISAALGADTTTMPCWANIRSTERWDTTRIPDGEGFRGDST